MWASCGWLANGIFILLVLDKGPLEFVIRDGVLWCRWNNVILNIEVRISDGHYVYENNVVYEANGLDAASGTT